MSSAAAIKENNNKNNNNNSKNKRHEHLISERRWGYTVRPRLWCPRWGAWSSSSSPRWGTAWADEPRSPPNVHNPSPGRWTSCSARTNSETVKTTRHESHVLQAATSAHQQGGGRGAERIHETAFRRRNNWQRFQLRKRADAKMTKNLYSAVWPAGRAKAGCKRTKYHIMAVHTGKKALNSHSWKLVKKFLL